MRLLKLTEHMKNWPWKRITLGAAVISSIAASSSFGTFAYFTDQKQMNTAFAAGKLEIGLGETKASFTADQEMPFLPGVRFEKDLVVNNNSDAAVKFALLASKANGDDVVYDQLMVEIRESGTDGGVLYIGKVKDLTRSNNVVSELAKDGSKTLHYTVYLPESAGNEVQQKMAEVDFGFLATQKENGEYFAQGGPVMTLTPEQFTSANLDSTLKVIEDAAEGTTFILGEGEYSIPDTIKLSNKVSFRADKGKEGSVKLKGSSDNGILHLENASVDGLTFVSGSGSALVVGSHVSIVNCTFEGGFDNAIRNAESKSEEPLADVTIKGSTFNGSKQAILFDDEAKAIMIIENKFDNVARAVSVKNTLDPVENEDKDDKKKDDKKKDSSKGGKDADDSKETTITKRSEVQVAWNDFSTVKDMAVESDKVRIGDGIDGFNESKSGGKLALHLNQLDIYLEGNSYAKKD